MTQRTQITLDAAMDRRAKERARQLGISFAEYVRRLIDEDIEQRKPTAGLADIIGLGDSGGSDVASREDEYLNQSLAAE